MKGENTMSEKRKDSQGRVLKTGESQRKDGVYQYRYTQNGKRYTIYAPSLKELREKEDKVQKAINDRVDYMRGKMMVGEICKQLVETKQNIKTTTKYRHQALLNMINNYEFSRLTANEVTTLDVKRWCIELSKKYQSGTIKDMFSIVRQSFQALYEDDVIRKNPCDFSLYRTIQNTSKSKYSLSDDEANAFLQCLQIYPKSNIFYRIAYLLLHTGMRISECLALTVKDIDFDNRAIFICKQLTRIKQQIHITSTKTKSGVRYIPIDDDVCKMLRTIVNEIKEPSYTIDGHSGFLFYYTNGIVSYSGIINAFTRYVKMYNEQYANSGIIIPNVSPHILRHTYCTNLSKQGVHPKALQYIMGHSSMHVTMDVYSHNSKEWAFAEFDKTQTNASDFTTPIITPTTPQHM